MLVLHAAGFDAVERRDRLLSKVSGGSPHYIEQAVPYRLYSVGE
jgi:hypothetical protein